MKEMKKWRRYIGILLVTAFLFTGGLYFIDRVVTPEGRAEALYDEPRESIDVLILGGSQTMCTLSCVEIYEGTGLTAYNFSTWSQPVWVSYYYLKEALKTQSPQVVVLDVFGSFYERTYMTGVDVDLVSDDYAALLRPSLNLLQLNLTRRRVQVTQKRWYEYLNIAKYHRRITQLTPESFSKLFVDDSTTAKGFGPFYTVEDFSNYQYPTTDEVVELYEYAQEYLVKTIELCQQRGIQIVLTKMPHTADEQDIAVLNGIHALAQQYNVDFLDYCTTNALNIDFATDYADHGHLNVYGAKKATAAMVKYLNGLGLQAVHSEAINQRWDDALAIEEKNIAQMEVRIAKSFDELVGRAAALTDSATILVRQGDANLSDADFAQMEELLSNTNFEMAPEAFLHDDVFVYAEGKLLAGEDAVQWCAAHNITVAGGQQAVIEQGDESFSYARDGLNLAVLDTETDTIYCKISFAKEHNYEPYTS